MCSPVYDGSDAALHCPLAQPNTTGTLDTPAGPLNLWYARAGVLRAECGDAMRLAFDATSTIPPGRTPSPD